MNLKIKYQVLVSNLATTSALTAVENKISIVSNLVKKTDYDTKVNEIEKKLTDYKHDKHITTPLLALMSSILLIFLFSLKLLFFIFLSSNFMLFPLILISYKKKSKNFYINF